MGTDRLRALDGLRAVAILLVVGSHFVSYTIPGGFGVTLFFFISGFIITRLLLEQPALLPFYVRRVFRLAPALLVFVAVVWVGDPAFPGDVRAALLYYANYHHFQTPVLDVTWSLAVEEHFYLLFPALVLMLTPRRLTAILVTFVAAVLVWRCVLVLHFGEIERLHRSSDTRLDSIAYGCLLSLLAVRPECRRLLEALSRRWALAAGFAVLLACFAVRGDVFRETVRYSLQGLALMPIFAALFLRGTAPHWLRTPLEWAPVVYIGTISYSLYLYHEVGMAFGIKSPAANVAIGVAATLLSLYLIEAPSRRFGASLVKVWARTPA